MSGWPTPRLRRMIVFLYCGAVRRYYSAYTGAYPASAWGAATLPGIGLAFAGMAVGFLGGSGTGSTLAGRPARPPRRRRRGRRRRC